MPIYTRRDKKYNIPEDKIKGFESMFPDAKREYYTTDADGNEHTYAIPVNRTSAFETYVKEKGWSFGDDAAGQKETKAKSKRSEVSRPSYNLGAEAQPAQPDAVASTARIKDEARLNAEVNRLAVTDDGTVSRYDKIRERGREIAEEKKAEEERKAKAARGGYSSSGRYDYDVPIPDDKVTTGAEFDASGNKTIVKTTDLTHETIITDVKPFADSIMPGLLKQAESSMAGQPADAPYDMAALQEQADRVVDNIFESTIQPQAVAAARQAQTNTDRIVDVGDYSRYVKETLKQHIYDELRVANYKRVTGKNLRDVPYNDWGYFETKANTQWQRDVLQQMHDKDLEELAKQPWRPQPVMGIAGIAAQRPTSTTAIKAAAENELDRTDKYADLLYEKQHREPGSIELPGRTLLRTVLDFDTWDPLAINDITTASGLVESMDAENLSATDRVARQILYGAKARADAGEQDYRQNMTTLEKGEEMTGQMLPFMLQMGIGEALWGGAVRGGSNLATRAAEKAIGKEAAESFAKRGVSDMIKSDGWGSLFTRDAMKYYGLKYVGVTLDDLTKAATLSNTLQLGQTTADIMSRHAGDVSIDPNNPQELTLSGGDSWGRAVWQGEMNSIIENYSEMFGSSKLDKLPFMSTLLKAGRKSKLGRKMGQMLGAKNVSRALRQTDAAGLVQMYSNARDVFSHLGISGYFGEVIEEYVGQGLRTLFNLDDAYTFDEDGNKVNNIFNDDFNGDILSGMAISMGYMGGFKGVFSLASYARHRHGVSRANKEAEAIFRTGRWQPLRVMINSSDNENIGDVANSIAADKDLTKREKSAALGYITSLSAVRGWNLGAMAHGRAQRGAEMEQSEQHWLNGYNSVHESDWRAAAKAAADAHKEAEAAGILEELDKAMHTDDGGAAADALMKGWREAAAAADATEEDRMRYTAAVHYLNAQAFMGGLRARVADSADNKKAEADGRLNARRDSWGNIRMAKDKNGRTVYIRKGRVELNADGTIDTRRSDEQVLVIGETGADARMVNVSELSDVSESVAVEQARKEAHALIDDEIQTAYGQAVEPLFEYGDVYDITDADGTERRVHVVADDKGLYAHSDGSITVTTDGRTTFTMTRDEIREGINRTQERRDKELSEHAPKVEAVILRSGDAVRVTSGNVAVNDNGEVVVEDSDDFIVVQFANGRKKVVHPKDIEREDRQPPANEPPANEPPANEPPANEPPANEPPANEPPANEPPANEPPANEPPANEPHTFKVGDTVAVAIGEDGAVRGTVIMANVAGNLYVVAPDDGSAPMEVSGENLLPVGAEQPTEQQPTEQPTEQQPTEQQPTEQQPTEQQPTEEQPTEQPTEQQPTEQQPTEEQPTEQQPTALDRVPKDANGDPMLESVDAETAYDAIAEMTGGDMSVVTNSITAQLAQLKNDLKKEKSKTGKSTGTITEKIRKEKELADRIKSIEQRIAFWESVQQIPEQRAKAEQEAKAKAEQEAKEKAEQEIGLKDVPEVTDDTPAAARARGFRKVYGYKVERQGPIATVDGKTTTVKFSDKKKTPGRFVLIDVNDLQPSHRGGRRNAKHFLDEAQPKERDDNGISMMAAQKIAGHINPEEITGGVTAYTGSPTVNTRGEVIQGNNRAIALDLMWGGFKDQAAIYKQYLIDHAEEFGLNADEIAAMERPVLVRMVDVTDEEAIALGQYVAADTESGGEERIKASNVMGKEKFSMREFARRLLTTDDEEATLGQLIDTNGSNVLVWMNTLGIISDTQLGSAIKKDGTITAEAKNDLLALIQSVLFEGQPNTFKKKFQALPASAQKAILATAYRCLERPDGQRFLDELRMSIAAYYDLTLDDEFNKSKKEEDILRAVDHWSREYSWEESTGGTYLRSSIYSGFALHLAALYRTMKQKRLAATFNEFYDLLVGKKGDLFEPDVPPMSLEDAVKSAFGIEYQPKKGKDNGQNGSISADSTQAASEQGKQGSRGDDRSGGQNTQGERSADNTGGTDADDTGKGVETAGTKGSEDIAPAKSDSDESPTEEEVEGTVKQEDKPEQSLPSNEKPVEEMDRKELEARDETVYKAWRQAQDEFNAMASEIEGYEKEVRAEVEGAREAERKELQSRFDALMKKGEAATDSEKKEIKRLAKLLNNWQTETDRQVEKAMSERYGDRKKQFDAVKERLGKLQDERIKISFRAERLKNDITTQGDGLHVLTYDDGQIKVIGTVKDGKTNGMCVAFDKEGNIQAQGLYKNGERVRDLTDEEITRLQEEAETTKAKAENEDIEKVERINDYGEKIEGARKDLLRDISKKLDNATEEQFVSLSLSKALPRPNIEKMVASGLLREEEAAVIAAMYISIVGEGKPRVKPRHKNISEREIRAWAKNAATIATMMKSYLEADNKQRDAMMAEIKAIRPEPDENSRFDGMGTQVTSLPVLLTALEKYGVGELMQIKTAHSRFFKIDTNGKFYCDGIITASFEELVEKIRAKIEIGNGLDHEFSKEELRVRSIYRKVPGKFVGGVRYRDAEGNIHKEEKEFDRMLAAKEYAISLEKRMKGRVSFMFSYWEFKREYDHSVVEFLDDNTNERITVAEYPSYEEASAAVDTDLSTLNDKANEVNKARFSKNEQSRGGNGDITPCVYYDRNSHVYFIGADMPRRNYNILTLIGANRFSPNFPTEKEAASYLKEHAEEIGKEISDIMLMLKEAMSKAESTFKGNASEPRRGKDWRKGKDVTAKEFVETFGFRGVQFGNWTDQRDRQGALNQAYDSFMDMADIIGVSPKALSLNGELGIAFGARGSGGASAHYESNEVVINLTKTKGAGTLAHEWWHAFDNYLSRHTGVAYGFVSERKQQNLKLRHEVAEAIRALMELVDDSSYYKRSARRGAYWRDPTELGARLFASWVAKKIQDNGNRSPFLTNHNEEEKAEVYRRAAYRAYTMMKERDGDAKNMLSYSEWVKKNPGSLLNFPYAVGDELTSLGAAMQKLFDTLEENTDEHTGNVVLFREGQGRGADTETVNAVAAELQDKFGVEVEVVESLDGVQNEQARKALAAGKVIKGWYEPSTGKVVIYAPNAESAQDVMATYAHEVVAHKGMRGLLGEERYNELCERLGAALTPEQRELVEEYEGSKDDVLGDEYIARIAEELIDEQGNIKEPTTWEKVKGAVREFFRDVFGLDLTDADIRYMLWRSGERLRRNKADVMTRAQDVVTGQKLKDDAARYRTTRELDRQHPGWRDQTTPTGRHSTQRANTVNTYRKIGEWIKREMGDGATVLDASSGLGLGTQELRRQGLAVDDVEPYPDSSREAPTFAGYDEIDKQYDVVVSNAVLNVVPDDRRSELLHQMADMVKPGGRIIINVRDAGEIERQKQKIELDSPSEVLVTDRWGNVRSYQKGFTPVELRQWVADEMGEEWTIEKADKNNSGLTGATAVVAVRTEDRRAEQVQSVVDGLSTKYGEGATVHSNEANLPADVARRIADGDIVKGWTDENGVHIFAPNATSAHDVETTYIHEMVAHVGMRKLLGKERYEELCERLGAALSGERLEKVSMYKGASTKELGDEYFAAIAEEMIDENGDLRKPKLWDRIKGVFRECLRNWFNIDLCDADIMYLLWKSSEHLRKGKKTDRQAQISAMLEMRSAIFRVAYHGTAVDFERFDHSNHMDEGEGAHIFGWGSYLTDVRSISNHYAQIARKRRCTRAANMEYAFLNSLPEGLSLNGMEFVLRTKIPDDNGTNYMSWDETISDEMLQAIEKDLGLPEGTLARESKMDGGSVYNWLRERLPGGEKEASLFLYSIGIIGNKVSTGYAHSGRTRESKNYIMFDAKDIKITGKESKKVNDDYVEKRVTGENSFEITRVWDGEKAVANYKDGELDGPYEERFPDGTVKKKCTYKNGEPDGPYEYRHSDGTVEKCTYKDGKKDGPYEERHPDGTVVKCTYKNDKKDGPYEERYSDGKLWVKCTYKNDKKDGPYEERYSDGKLWEKCTYKNDKLDGPYEYRHPDGTVEKCTYKNGELDGPYEYRHSDGTVEKCTYKNGKLDGPYVRLDSDGKIVKKTLYEDDVPVRDLTDEEVAEVLKGTDDGIRFRDDPLAAIIGNDYIRASETKAQTDRMVNATMNAAEKLGLDNVVVLPDGKQFSGRKARAKGWYDFKTGKIYIIAGNHTSEADILATLMHEAVAHYGLRQLMGEKFDTFLDDVYNNADPYIQYQIDTLAEQKYNGDRRTATEEYMASMAEGATFSDSFMRNTWEKIKHLFRDALRKLGLKDARLDDSDLRYILWRSYNNLKGNAHSNVFAAAEDAVARQAFAADEQTAAADRQPGSVYDAEETDALFRDGDPEMHREAMARDSYEHLMRTGAYQTQEALQDSMLSLEEAMRLILGNKKDFDVADVPGWQNAYLGENRLTSKTKAECDLAGVILFRPLMKAVERLARNDKERTELIDYMMAKHGLERNVYMAERDAQKAFEEYQAATPNGTKTLQDFIDKYRQKDYAGLTALTGEQDVAAAEDAARDMVAQYESSHDKDAVDDLWKKTNAVNKAILDKQLECGMISKETYDKIRAMYKNYIPLRGFDETVAEDMYTYLGGKESPFNAPIKTAHGRKSKADDPFANMQTMMESAIIQGNRNLLVAQRFLNYVLNHPSDLVSVSDLWLQFDDISGEWVAVFPDNIDNNDDAATVAQKMKDFNEKMEQLAANKPDKYMSGRKSKNIPYRVKHKRNLDEHFVIARVNGESRLICINGNPRLAQALNGKSNPDNEFSGAAERIASAVMKVNRALSMLYTTLSPDFMLSNFCRDMIYSNVMAHVKNSGRYGRTWAAAFHINCARYNPKVMHSLLRKWRKGKLNTGKEMQRLFFEFMKNGGETGYIAMTDIETRKKNMIREIKRSRQSKAVLRGLTALWENYEDAMRAVELSARFSAFVTSRNMGRSLDRSIWDAKEVSVNFNKKGSGSKFLGAKGQTAVGNLAAFTGGMGRLLFVFWGAGMQGMANFWRAYKRHPVKGTAAILTFFAAGFMQGFVNSIIGGGDGDGDDDEDENKDVKYWDLPEHVRRQNIIAHVWGDNFLAVPLPIEFRAFYGIGELASTVAFNDRERKTPAEYSKDVASQLTQLLPVDVLEGKGTSSLVPSAFKPLVEAYALNQSWTGYPITNSHEWNEQLPEWTKAYKGTSKVLIGWSKTLNEATGGDDYTKGWIEDGSAGKIGRWINNPAQVEYVLNGYLGGLYSTFERTVKTASGAVEGEFNPQTTPLVNRMWKQTGDRTGGRNVNTEYYKIKYDAEEAKRRFDAYKKAAEGGSFEYAEKMNMLYYSPEYRRYLIYHNSPEREYIDKLNKRKKELPDTAKTQRNKIDSTIYRMKTNIVDRVHEYEEDDEE